MRQKCSWKALFLIKSVLTQTQYILFFGIQLYDTYLIPYDNVR